MSRQTKLGKIIQEGLDNYYGQDDDDYNQDYDSNDHDHHLNDGPPEETEYKYGGDAIPYAIQADYLKDLDTLNEDDDQPIEDIMAIFRLTKQQAVRLYVDCRYDATEAHLTMEKEERDNQRHKKDAQKKAQKSQSAPSSKLPQKPLDRIPSKGEDKSANVGIKLLKDQKRISSSSNHSLDDPDHPHFLSKRKSSMRIEEYDVGHYNSIYPSLAHDPLIQPSKSSNIVVVGHVDSGKSTLVGMLLQMMKVVPRKELIRNQKESKQIGKQSFKYAWCTDSTEEERIRGVTIDVGVKKVDLPSGKQLVFLDSPGHRDFIPNMITGAAQADYAILVIDASGFQSTFISGGQTKQHAYIVKSLGVQRMIVAINKMDVIQWSIDKFKLIQNKLNFYLHKIGFLPHDIIYVPISALKAFNLIEWNHDFLDYKDSLLTILDSLPPPIRPVDKPLRLSISNFYESSGGKIRGHCVAGKIEGGVLHKDQKVLILPQNTQCIVRDIVVMEEKVKQATVGDLVDVQVKLVDEIYFETIKYGHVLSSLQLSVPVAKKFVMDALALDLQMPILKGTEVVIYVGMAKSSARIIKINYVYDPHNGSIIKKNPKAITSNDCVEIEIETKEKICLELFSNFKTLGRVIVREGTATICVGTVKKICAQ